MIYVLAVVCWIAITFLSMFMMSITLEVYYKEMFDESVIFLSLLFWYFLIPVCLAINIIRLVAYPFRKTWW